MNNLAEGCFPNPRFSSKLESTSFKSFSTYNFYREIQSQKFSLHRMIEGVLQSKWKDANLK
jgi:hypothetical protein